MNVGLIYGIAGSAVGVAGGVLGTHFSIKNTKGPRERHIMMRASLVVWFGMMIFLAALFFVPHANSWIWYPYCVILPVGIVYINRRQQSIRREEQT